MLTLKTPPEVAQEIAAKVREERLGKGWTQADLAERSGISLATYIVFERTGRIALLRLIRIFASLGIQNEIETLTVKTFRLQSLDALVKRSRKRGRSSRRARSVP